jgi:hypothetical protein
VSGCAVSLGGLVALAMLVLALFGLKGWTVIGAVALGLAFATWQIVRQLRR